MKIQEGKRYVRRDGSVTNPLITNSFGDFLDEETNFCFSEESGLVYGGEEKDPKDLIKEYKEMPEWTKFCFKEIDYIKPNKMENPTKEQVLKAAEKSQKVKEALMELYPEAFEDELELGDLVRIDGFVYIIGRCGEDKVIPISLDDGNWYIEPVSDGGSILKNIKAAVISDINITKLNKSDYINIGKL